MSYSHKYLYKLLPRTKWNQNKNPRLIINCKFIFFIPIDEYNFYHLRLTNIGDFRGMYNVKYSLYTCFVMETTRLNVKKKTFQLPHILDCTLLSKQRCELTFVSRPIHVLFKISLSVFRGGKANFIFYFLVLTNFKNIRKKLTKFENLIYLFIFIFIMKSFFLCCYLCAIGTKCPW